MCADDGGCDPMGRRWDPRDAGGGARPVAPIGAPRARMRAGGYAGEKDVRARARDQRHARGQAVGAHPRGIGDRAEVEQIDEIGVGPELRVGLDRIGLDLGARKKRGIVGTAMMSNPATPPRSRASGRRACSPPRSRDRVEIARALDDLAGHRMQRLGPRLQEAPDRP